MYGAFCPLVKSKRQGDYQTMNLLKKCAALLTAGALCFSMSACASSDTGWIMRKDQLEMPAGVYINNLIQSYYDASTMVEDPDADVLDQEIEGQPAADWIEQNAIDETKKEMAICSEFSARNIAFPEDQLLSCQQQAQSYYDQSGDNLEKNGIAQGSIELIYQISYMKTQLFQALYGPSGEDPVSDEELSNYYDDNYIKMAVQTFSFSDMEIPEDATEDEKAAYEEFNDSERSNVYTNANTFYLQAKIGTENGQSFNDILNEYKKENQSSDEEYDMTTDNYRLLDTATTTLDADVIKALKEAEVGEVVMVQTDSMIAVGATADIHEDPTDFDYVKDSIRHALRDETMEEYLLQQAQDSSYILNQKAVDRYQIEKLDLD